jgi:peptide-methionine (S)-S-oxide reductase
MSKTEIVSHEKALKGRHEPLGIDNIHYVKGVSIKGPFAPHLKEVIVAMGCFWGVERLFWQLDGVYVTAVGYLGGITPNPTYEEVCSGLTGHTEGVLVVYDPAQLSLEHILKTFWENHDPTQGMRQGGDIGTQYRSGLYLNSQDEILRAQQSRSLYQKALTDKKLGAITTEIRPSEPFYYAETYHQGYLAKNPGGYCGLKGTGAFCPIG